MEKLIQLLLISPASSCEAERTFSALCRMKTWLRSTMTQRRLDDLMLCNIHKDILHELDPKTIASEFIGAVHSDSEKMSGILFLGAYSSILYIFKSFHKWD